MSTETAPTTQAGAELYRGSFDFVRLPLGEGQELVYLPLTRSAHALSALAVRLLQGCRTFATLDEHAVRLCRELNVSPRQGAEVRQELAALARIGFLLSQRDLLTRVRSRPGPPVPRIAALGIPTRNRTPSLQHCLESYIRNNQCHGRSVEYVVADDSDDSSVRRSNRQLLQELKSRHGLALAYAGPEEKVSFAEALVERTGLSAEDVRFGFVNDDRFPIATGGSRNALLLHAVGDVLLQVDDDTVCSLAPVPGFQGGLAFTSEYDPTEFWFPEEGEPLAFRQPAGDEPSILAVHEQLLGKGLGDCLGELDVSRNASVDLDRAGAGFFRRAEPAGGRVLATAAGVMGDSGMGSPLYFPSLEGASRTRLLHSEGVYRHAFVRQQVVRAVLRPTISDGALCMALNFGLDQRELLPPFPPVQRNQDGDFAALLRACFGARLLRLPALDIAAPVPRFRQLARGLLAKGGSGEQWANPSGSGGFVCAWSKPGAPHRKTWLRWAEPLERLGYCRTGWTSRSWCGYCCGIRPAEKVVQLENQLRAAQGQPGVLGRGRTADCWTSAQAKRCRSGNMGGAERSSVSTFGNDAFGCLQRLVRRFGRLLQVWPDMVAAALDLRARGRRLGVEI